MVTTMASICVRFSLFVIIVLCIISCECRDYDTTTNSELDVEDASVSLEIIRARKGSSSYRPTPNSRYMPTGGHATSRPTYPTPRTTVDSRHVPTRKITTTSYRPSRHHTTTSTTKRPTTTSRAGSVTSRKTTTTTTTRPPWTRTTTKPPRTKPPKTKLPFPKAKYAALFGGLAGSTLGLYLGNQISKIDWEGDMPAYTVRHYWHSKGYPLSTSTSVRASGIVECPKNVSFCVRNSMAMCLSSGKIYCVTSEFQTQPCTNSTVGACLATTVQVKCSNMWGVDCFLTGYKDVDVSIPCLKYTRVKYVAPTTKYNADFYFPSNYTVRTPDKNNTCKCNNTQLAPSKIDISCIKLNVSESERTFCSGLNLTNLTIITMNSTLNSTNSKKLSCLGQNIAGSVGDIFEAQTKSALARCEFENGSFGVNMKCGNIENLYDSNVSIPIQANVAVLRCSMENATSLNQTCQCNSTVTPGEPTKQENSTQTPIYTVRYCVAIAAYPMRLYNNKAYLLHLNEFPELKEESANAANKILTVLGRYLFF